MKNILRLVLGVAAAAFFFGSALAQTSGNATNHAFAIGKGPGVTGFTSLLCATTQIPVGQTSADPICRTVTGDVTINASGVTAIGATKVLNSMLATMAANTTKCNATAGSAVPTDCSASTMRTNIGAVIGTNVQAWDADLDAFALKTAPSGAVVGTTDTQTLTNKSIVATQLTGTLQAGQFPALTGDVTTSAGALATTIAANAVTNAKAAQMSAYTIKGNATGSTANATDISIPALTQKASPVSGDMMLIVDSAASNALKYALVSSIASAGSVSSIAGNTGAFTLSNGITNSTNDIRVDPATQSDQETATNTAKPVTAGRQQYHPSASKAWGRCTESAGTYTLQSSYNIAAATCGKTGTGALSIAFSVSFSGTNTYACVGSPTNNTVAVIISNFSGGAVQVSTTNTATGAAQDAGFSFVCFGDQ